MDQVAQMIGRIHAQIGHAAVRDAPVLDDFKPIDAAMADADPVHVRWLGNDHKIGPVSVYETAFSKEGDTREATALFVNGAALLHCSQQLHAAAAKRFDGIYGRRNPRLLVRCTAPKNLSIAQQAAKGIDGPAL